MTLILPVPLSGSVYVSLKADAQLVGYSRHHTRSRLTFLTLVPSRSLQEVAAKCTRGPLVVPRFASNV